MKCPSCRTENPPDSKFCKECATPLPTSRPSPPRVTETLDTGREELTTGSFFAGRYQIIEQLGQGGMGRVYRALDRKLNEEVALKLVRPEIAADRSTLERFSNELKLARKISHPHVGRMYELMEEKGLHFITMEYVPGQDLRGLIRQTGQLTVGKATAIAKEICEGLTEAHKQGVIHRDLKPSNIIIDRAGDARIMDFGIARSMTVKSRTGAGIMIGTPEYMSPEQVEGKEVDARSDIYSLGIILYEMLTGRVPFEGDTPFTVGMKQKTEIPKDPRTFNRTIPDSLKSLVLRCLEKSKEKRYQSAGDIFEDLRRIEQSIPLVEEAAPPKAQDKERTDETKRKSSIAVLPFSDLSPQRDQEYFCDGFAEELINALAKVEKLQVASRTSAFHLKTKGYDIQEIGSRLKVQTVLEGSVRKAGNRIRITAQLVDVADGYQIWSGKFDRDMEDIFAIQDEVTLAIVDALRIRILGDEKGRILRKYTDDIEAYNLYLKGRFFVNRRKEEDLKKSIECFQQAIDKDPDYALAYSGMADAFSYLPYYSSFDPKEALKRGKEAALEALKRDDLLADAHTSMGVCCNSSFEFAVGEREFKRALELDPSSLNTHHQYSNLLMYLGRFEESFEEIERALVLDPLSLIVNRDLGELYYYCRQYDQAIEQYQKTLEIDPNYVYVHLDLGLAYLQKSLFEEALKEIQKEDSDAWLAVGHALSGKRDLAKKSLEDLETRQKAEQISPYALAALSSVLGDNDRAFKWLENAYQEHNVWLIYLKIEPLLDGLRRDPRYTPFIKKVGLD